MSCDIPIHIRILGLGGRGGHSPPPPLGTDNITVGILGYTNCTCGFVNAECDTDDVIDLTGGGSPRETLG